jgi:hypothetical protein
MWYACTFAFNYYDEHGVFNKPINVGDDFYIEKCPDWVKADEAIEYMSWHDRQEIKDSEIVFSKSYEAEALGSPDPSCNRDMPRSIQNVVDEKFMLLGLALWLVKPSKLSGSTVMHFSDLNDSGSMRRSGKLNTIHVDSNELYNIIDKTDVLQAKSIFTNILNLKRDSTVWTAVRTLITALREDTWEVRFLLLWVVLEALFGADNGQEISYRLSQRAAFFIGNSSEESKDIFKKVKSSYTVRSKTIHGMRLSKLTPEKSEESILIAEEVIRKSLKKIFSNDELRNKINSKNRDDYFDALVFI